jgi:hypothetical protein
MRSFWMWGVVASLALVACGGNTRQDGEVKTQPPSEAGSGGSLPAGAPGAGGSPPAQAGQGSRAGASPSGEAGEGGAGGTISGPCAGIEGSCVPGEVVCDAVRGKRTTCGDCGEPLPGGDEDCVRVIGSDKESDGVCVVRGKSELQCWQLWDEPVPMAVTEEAVELLLPDDSASQRSADWPCVGLRSGGYSCLPKSCTRGAVGDAGACGVCGGSLYCEGNVTQPEHAQTTLVDVAVTDSSVFVLGELGVQEPYAPARLPTAWKGKPASLRVDHDFKGCIVSDLGELSCWETLTEPLLPARWTGSFRKLVPTSFPYACLLDDARQVRCGSLFDPAPEPIGQSDIVDFVASRSVMCTLSVAGRVSCWEGLDTSVAIPLETPVGW